MHYNAILYRLTLTGLTLPLALPCSLLWDYMALEGCPAPVRKAITRADILSPAPPSVSALSDLNILGAGLKLDLI